MSTETLEQLRHNAENATRAKSIFLSNMSHEIRTPLNALSGFSALLTEEGLDDSTRRQCTDIIQQNSELLLCLVFQFYLINLISSFQGINLPDIAF